ncbi:metal-dependent hydrolase [Halorussus gelatinilyticus]|uniref:Metal-dependent hydrolase n=1 Tax=Halorussus gelatinilyticus TaxID=2937524 RepID=A0A8U0II61_9EURY|nr:metal-dependent hydrolase [Halorussus gelatinilyticus]UPW00790.1 metal-dependent hydrolase [Halorussus gelatinilyticus]
MPSTVVHVALAGLVGTALLADYFDGKAVAVVMAAVVLVDFDVFVGFWIEGAHRAAFHTLLLPLLGGILLWADLRRGDDSLVRSQWGAQGVRVGWVTLVAVTFAGIGLDAFFNGVNLLYPVHDRFYTFDGKVFYSTKEGFVQTLVNVDFEALVETFAPEQSGGASEAGSGGASAGSNGGNSESVRTTENTHYSTGIDPKKGAETGSVERLFPIAYTGERALLALTGYSVVGLRVWMERRE